MSAAQPLLVDARGHHCPVPTLRLQRALDALQPGAQVRLLADDPMARIDVPHFASSRGLILVDQTSEGAALSFLVEVPPSPPPGPAPSAV